MVVVKDGVVNEPIVPLPPPPVDVHEVLLVDVQLSVDVAPFATEDGVAVRVTTGVAAATVTPVFTQNPIAGSSVLASKLR